MEEKLEKFILRVAAQRDTDVLPITLATQMLQTLPAQRPRAMEVLQHSWLEPPLFGTYTPVPRQPLNQAAPPAMDAPPSSGGPAQPTPGVAALILKGQSLPSSEGPAQLSPEVAALEASSGGPAQLSPEVAALKGQPLLSSGGPPLEPHPKLRHLIQSASLLPHLVPGDLPAFLAAVRSLREHQGNLLLHSILAFSKYPTVLEDLAPRLAKLPKQLKAQVGAPSTSAVRGCVNRPKSSTGSSSNQSHHLRFTCTRFTCRVGLVQTRVRCAEIWFRLGLDVAPCGLTLNSYNGRWQHP